MTMNKYEKDIKTLINEILSGDSNYCITSVEVYQIPFDNPNNYEFGTVDAVFNNINVSIRIDEESKVNIGIFYHNNDKVCKRAYFNIEISKLEYYQMLERIKNLSENISSELLYKALSTEPELDNVESIDNLD